MRKKRSWIRGSGARAPGQGYVALALARRRKTAARETRETRKTAAGSERSAEGRVNPDLFYPYETKSRKLTAVWLKNKQSRTYLTRAIATMHATRPRCSRTSILQMQNQNGVEARVLQSLKEILSSAIQALFFYRSSTSVRLVARHRPLLRVPRPSAHPTVRPSFALRWTLAGLGMAANNRCFFTPRGWQGHRASCLSTTSRPA